MLDGDATYSGVGVGGKWRLAWRGNDGFTVACSYLFPRIMIAYTP